MKSVSFASAALLAASGFVHSQEASPSGTTTSVITTARILGDIPGGSPPPVSEPEPEFNVAPSDILQTTTLREGARNITIQQIKPVAMPPPPTPQPAKATTVASAEFQQRLTAYREAHPRSGTMCIGATVYRSGDQPPRTLIQVWPEGGGEAIELWSSVDMALIAGGIRSFSDSAGNTHHLFISWSNVYIDRLSDLSASQGREHTPPPMPTFAAGDATFQVVGNQPAAEDLTAIQSLHDLYNKKHAELLTAYQGRENARLAREAESKAHPPQPKDITLRYWRTERPAAQGKGGAR